MKAQLRRLLWIFLIGGLAGIGVWFFLPVNSTMTRLLLLGSLSGTWLSALILGWRAPAVRWGQLAATAGVAVFLALPARPLDPAKLGADYVRNLRALEGRPYHWGGESPLGIDCSGLPRRAYRQAILRQGLTTLNGGAVRQALLHWWHDASAMALGEGYRGYTLPLKRGGTIREMDYAGLRPGDLAVTDSGVHILAYLGDDLWIQADPGAHKVLTLNGRIADNDWFRTPVKLHRWKELSQ
jgi:hypothetical protein